MRNIRWLFSNWQLLVVYAIKNSRENRKSWRVQIINLGLVRVERATGFFNILKCLKLTGNVVDDHSSRVGVSSHGASLRRRPIKKGARSRLTQGGWWLSIYYKFCRQRLGLGVLKRHLWQNSNLSLNKMSLLT